MRTLLLASSALLFAQPVLAQTTSAPADSETERGDDIVVTATRSETPLEQVPASVTVQDVDDLRRNGFTFGTDEYRGVPGVFFRRGEGDGDEFPFVSFRGSLGTEGSLSLVDGIPIVGLYEETQLNEIPYDAVERVEIVRGPVSALYGRGALYGATNYILRDVGERGVTASLSAGSDDFYRGEATLSLPFAGDGGALLTGSYEDYGGWRANGGRRIWNIFGKVDFQLGAATDLSIYANYNDRFSDLPNGIPLDAQGEVIDVAGGRAGFLGFGAPFNDTQNLLTALRLEHRFNDDLSVTARASYRNIDRFVRLNFFDPFSTNLSAGVAGFNGFRGETSQRVYFGEGVVNWRSGSHNIIAGASYERSNIREDIRWSGQNGFTPECGFTFFAVEVDVGSGNVLNRNNPCFVIDAPLTNDAFTNTFWGAFIQDEISLTDRWTLTLGGRYDSFRRTATYFPIADVTPGGVLRGSADAFSPKATLSYRTDWGQIYAAYGRGFNSNFGATFEWDPVQYARPETRPTTIDSYEIGVKGRALGDAVRFEAAIYLTRQRNRRQIVDNPAAAADFTQPFNLVTFGDLYEGRGFEAAVEFRPARGTNFRFNYSYIDPEWISYSLNTFAGPVDYSGRTPTGVPQHIVYASVDQQVTPWLNARAILEWYDDYFITIDNRVRTGGYELVTLNARIAPPNWRGVTLDLTLLNALDRDYYSYFGGRENPTYAVPGPPRQFRVTLRGQF
jgi:outer membrane receptor protein involved in Fe transport